MASSGKTRQPRLRASCDGCFLAKVKCSKARPICSRCLACGIDCRYSPSSRAGKPKSDNSGASSGTGRHDFSEMHSLADDNGMVYASVPPRSSDHMFKMDTGWSSPHPGIDGAMSRNTSIASGLALLGVEDRAMGEPDPMSAPPEMYSAAMPWQSSTDLSYSPFPAEVPVTGTHMPNSHMRSQSFDVSMSAHMPWSDPSSHDMMAYSQVPTPTAMASHYFPSSRTPPNMRPVSTRPKSSFGINGGACTCFTACLQSLQALHNASSPTSPPFDLVLSVNRKAVEGCAAMLSCSRCMNRSGSHTGTMLLATVIGKITSFYKNASHSYLENGGPDIGSTSSMNNPGVSVGGYHFDPEDGKWLEFEILGRELRKLEDLYAKFQEVCAELSDDPEVTRAMIGYLGQNLGSTLEAVNHKKGDAAFP